MTVPVSNRISQLYVGNGVNTRFDFTFRAFGQEDATGIAVRVKVGSEFEFLDKSLYEVIINQDGLGGYVTFTSPPSVSTFFYISGQTPVDQLLDITNYDNFYPDAIERALDKITAILQEWGSLIDFEEQSRILADINYDLLAQARETDLKNYIDTIVANITGAPLAESQFVTYVDSVSDLPTLLKWDGRVAYVKNISHFEYDESTDDWVLKVTPIQAGGSGGITAQEARTNLDIYSKDEAVALLGFLPYMPTPYPKAIPPDKHMAMMGQSLNPQVHPILFSLYGPTLPDMRAYSIRGLDYGRGIDVGRVVLSEQEDEIKAHTHTTARVGSAPIATTGSWSYRDAVNGQTGSTGGGETRVKNIAYLYIVREG